MHQRNPEEIDKHHIMSKGVISTHYAEHAV